MTNNRPVRTVKLGPIHAAIWGHDTDKGNRIYKVTVQKRYFDREANDFGGTQNFGRDDLPMVTNVLDQAYTVIFDLQKADRATSKQAASSEEETSSAETE